MSARIRRSAPGRVEQLARERLVAPVDERDGEEAAARLGRVELGDEGEVVVENARVDRLRGDVDDARGGRPQQAEHEHEEALLVGREDRDELRGNVQPDRVHDDERPLDVPDRAQRHGGPELAQPALQIGERRLHGLSARRTGAVCDSPTVRPLLVGIRARATPRSPRVRRGRSPRHAIGKLESVSLLPLEMHDSVRRGAWSGRDANRLGGACQRRVPHRRGAHRSPLREREAVDARVVGRERAGVGEGARRDRDLAVPGCCGVSEHGPLADAGRESARSAPARQASGSS